MRFSVVAQAVFEKEKKRVEKKMVDYGTTVTLLGVGVVAFDVYAYYKYRHSLDVAAERQRKQAMDHAKKSVLGVEGDTVSLKGISEETAKALNDAREDAVVFETEEGNDGATFVGEVEGPKLTEFQPDLEEQVQALSQGQEELAGDVRSMKQDLKDLSKSLSKPKRK